MGNKKTYTIKEALDFVKKGCGAKFDSTVEAHFNLNVDIKKGQTVRFTTSLPHGTGKTQKIAVFASKKVANADLELSEEDLEKIEKGDIKPGVDFDVLVAEPRFMAKIAKVARILGPAGVMPNPKAGTVTEEVEKAVEQFKKGKIEVRTEPEAPIIHTIIGKRSFDNKDLKDNFEEIYTALKQNKPNKTKSDWIKNCFITCTMGPSAQIALD